MKEKPPQKPKMPALVLVFILATLVAFIFLARDTGTLPARPDRLMENYLREIEVLGAVRVGVFRFGNQVYPHEQQNNPNVSETNGGTPTDHLGEGIDAWVKEPLGIDPGIVEAWIAQGIMILADRQQLNFDTDVTQFLGEFESGQKGVSIERLLTHTSGLGHESEPKNQHDAGIYAVENYQLLADVIETVSGETLAIFFDKNIWQPLVMTNTFYDPQSPPENAWKSSIEDLGKWEKAFHTNQVVSFKTYKKGYRPPRLPDGLWGNYSFGWAVESYGGLRLERTFEPGINGGITRFPEKNFAVVLMVEDSKMAIDAAAIGRRIGQYYLVREFPDRSFQTVSE